MLHMERVARILPAALLAMMTLLYSSASAEKRVALVIGNGAYQRVPALPNPANDVKLIADALTSAGFAVTPAENLGREDFLRTLRTFRDQADSADWAMVYYAGHGLEMGGTNYLVPVDARLEQDRDVPDEAITLDRILNAVDGARTLRLVILDACRNNPFLNGMKRSPGADRSVGRGLARVEPSQATIVAYSAKAGSVAADGDTQNSPYASALARRLQESGTEVTKLFRLVRDDVLDATGRQQEPFMYGSVPGKSDLYFREPVAPPVVVAPALPPSPPPAPTPSQALVDAGQVWATTQASTSVAVLSAFIERFRGTVYADLAAARLTELQKAALLTQGDAPPLQRDPPVVLPGPDPASADPAKDLALRLQQALVRIGCMDGTPDGRWGAASRQALKDYFKYARPGDTDLEPTQAALDKLGASTGRVCPLVCGAKFERSGDACVAKTCPSGMNLAADGSCKTSTVPAQKPPGAGRLVSSDRKSWGPGPRCNHGSPCDGAYPPEQTSDPGWCESHFAIATNGMRYHRCPFPWK